MARSSDSSSTDRYAASVELERDAILAGSARSDFLTTVQILEAFWTTREPGRGGVGFARDPDREYLRFRQTPTLSFQGRDVDRVRSVGPGRDEVASFFFGLFGPNGALPTHITERALGRDPARPTALADFADVFHHRFLSLFYRAWTLGNPQRMRRGGGAMADDLLGSLFGWGDRSVRQADPVPFTRRLECAGRYARRVRSAEGLRSILDGEVDSPITIRQFHGEWLELEDRDRTRLGRRGAATRLGGGAVLGGRSFQRQYRVLIEIGPMPAHELDAMLGGSDGAPPRLSQVNAVVRGYLGEGLSWSFGLLVDGTETPEPRLGGGTRLGRTLWLGERRPGTRRDLAVRRERIEATSTRGMLH